ncbi:MAG: sugar porter family MFS transporter [Chitinispirillales bacterium]|jgi:SP family sugar:H+ symporter-like MFS transporter|nr:sugar porter family MFS transporter [Chitinispirillales bacterium]
MAAQKEYSLAYALLISCTAALGGFLFGFDTAVINGTMDALRFKFSASDAQLGFAVSIAVLGAAAGAFSAGALASRFGRRNVMMASSLIFFASAIGCGYPYFFTTSGTAANFIEFVTWRALGGIGIGAVSIIVPAYIAEISPAALRGRFASMQQLAIVGGIFVALLSNYFIAQAAGGEVVTMDAARNITGVVALGRAEVWQWMFWIECIPAALYGILLIFIPESPRHLVACKQYDKAVSVLGKVLNPSIVAQKIEDIKKSLKSDTVPKFSDLLEKVTGKTRLAPIVWVGIGIAALQQFVGINVIFYYSTILWESVGFTQEKAMFTSVLTSAVSVGSTLIAIALVDKIGRKPLLLAGSVGMFVTLGLMAAIFAMAGIDDHGNPVLEGAAALTAVISANLYAAFFAFSWGPVCWIMLGEMFNNRIRGAALALGGLSQWLSNFAITTTFPILLAKIGLGGAYGMYCFFAFISIFFVISKVKETKGKELEEM